MRSMGGSCLYGFSLMCSLQFSFAVLPEKASCPIPAACSSVGTLPGLRDLLSRSGSLRCFPCRGIPFRMVIHFSRCSSSMNYPKSTRKKMQFPGILRELHFRAIFNFKIAVLQFSCIMGNRKRRCCVWLYPEHPDKGFLICATAIIFLKSNLRRR